MRRAEGGVRATAYTSCFTPSSKNKIAQFRPIFYFTDEDKKEYEKFCNVKHSDCYEIWGMRRTGCACCPFGSRFEEELELAKKYEPKLYKTANKIFGNSYEYTRGFREFKEEYKKQRKQN